MHVPVQDGVAGALPVYHGTRDAILRIIQEESWRALYAGIAPALLGAGGHLLMDTCFASAVVARMPIESISMLSQGCLGASTSQHTTMQR